MSAPADSSGNLTTISSPNGRWVQLTYDASYRITQARDSLGRTVTCTYDGSGRLATVTDPAGGVTTYTYDASHRMLTLTDARQILFLTNEYDASGRVSRQTQADGTTYQFAYRLDGGTGTIAQVDVTDPRSIIRRVTFNASGYPLTDTRALGRPEQQGTTSSRQTSTHFLLAVTDPLGRQTAFAYDALGNPTTITRLAGLPRSADLPAAGAEVRIVPLGIAVGVVCIGEHRDPARLTHVFLEEALVVLDHVDALLHPRALVGGKAGSEHADLGAATARLEVRAAPNPLAPDVLD